MIPIIGSASVPFYHKLGLELKKRGYSICYVSGVRSRSRYGLREIHGKLGGDGFFFVDVVERAERIRDRGVDVDSEMRRIKSQYGIKSFRGIYFPEMAHTYHESDRDDRKFVALTVYAFLVLEELFEQNRVGCVIQFPGPELIRRVLYNVARRNGVLSVWRAWSQVPGCVTFYSSEMKVLDDLEVKDYSSLTSEEIEAAKSYVSRFRETRGRMVLHVEKKKKRQKAEAKHLGIIPGYRKLDIFVPMVFDCYDLSLLRGFLSFVKHFIYKRLKSLKKFFYYKIVYPSLEESKHLIHGGNYLFFPIQYPRESRITVRAPQFFNQEKFVDLVAKSLPEGYKLYVKDHPGLVGELSYRTVRKISETENVAWLNPRLPAYDAIVNSSAVITINNTPGYEAIIYQKPVITLGLASYGGYGVTVDVEDHTPDSVRRAILEAIDKGVSEDKLISFVSAMLRASHPGSFYETDEENISKMADYILDFKDRHSTDFDKNPRVKKALRRFYYIS